MLTNPARRKAVYGAAAAFMALLLAFDVIQMEQLELSVAMVERLALALTSFMAWYNTDVEA